MSEFTQVYYSVYESPVGELLLTSEGGMLASLNMALQQGKPAPSPKPQWRRDDQALSDVREQLDAYFAGERQIFDLPLRMTGTPFQKQVWQGLMAIPYGTTISYAELARRIGRPGARAPSGPRTVGTPSESSSRAIASSAQTARSRATAADWTGRNGCWRMRPAMSSIRIIPTYRDGS